MLRIGFLISALCAGSAWAQAPVDFLHDTDVAVDSTLVRGAEATVFITVTAAYGLRGARPTRGAATSVTLQRKASRVALLAAPTTDDSGVAVARFRVPNVETGDYELVVRTRSSHGDGEIRKPVSVVDGTALSVRTDRGVYKAGQTIRWRVTVLNRADAHPIPTKVDVVVRDPRQTAIWRGTAETDATGMVAGEVPLGEDLVLGSYVIEASAGEAKASESVKVREFQLAPFELKIEPSSETPLVEGAQVRGRVVARYSHGEPVAGKISLRIESDEHTLLRKRSSLDRYGRASFSTKLTRSQPIRISASVTDGAGRTQEKSLVLPVRSDELALTLVPDGPFSEGQEQWVTAITTDGEGNLAPARVYLRLPGERKRLRRDSKGAVRFAVTLKELRQIQAGAVDSSGRVATARLWPNSKDTRAQVHAKQVVVTEGQLIELSGSWDRPRGPLVATLLKQGNPSSTTSVSVDRRGQFSTQIRAPEGLFGLATVRLTELGWDRDTGLPAVTTAHTNVYLEPARLSISIGSNKRYRPGQDASLSVLVKDANGRPAAGVALAASVVDERVLALSEPRPSLVEVLRTMDVSSAEAAGVLFADLLRRENSEEDRLVMRAILASLPADSGAPQITLAAAERLAAELARVKRVQPKVYDYLFLQARPLGKKDGTRWEFADSLPSLIQTLHIEKLSPVTPWNRPTTWTYARELVPTWTFDEVAPRIANQRLDDLEERLYKLRRQVHKRLHRSPDTGLRALIDEKRVDGHLGIDPWGTDIKLVREKVTDGTRSAFVIHITSAGRDLVFGTKDDLRRSDVLHDATWSYGIGGTGSGYGYGSGRGGMRGRKARSPRVMMGSAESAMSVATRRRFDETVLWVAGIRTDAAGKARLRVPLADSITGWEVAIEALGRAGAVGAAKARLETALPMYVDADVPATLTVGDVFELRPVAANHERQTKKLRVEMQVAGSIAAVGASTDHVSLEAGTTQAVRFPIRATKPGTGTVTLTLFDDQRAVDRVERKLESIPPGALERRVVSGALNNGAARLALEVPEGAAEGSFYGMLRAFRGAADEALDGLEGMLQEPYGCFEQTSSTTYPNLLVLDLLSGKPGMAAARSRARTLVGKGYQRLISYEVDGGGFSWFGDAPANQILTAYGLMEFVDMSRVYPVDPQLVERTRKWLLSKQHSDGAWSPDKNWLHDWDAVQGKVSTTAYIAWALAESGYKGRPLERALGYLRRNRGSLARDPYLLALWAAAESRADTGYTAAMRELDRKGREEEGALRFSAGNKTLFYASGTSADVQVTALAASALGYSNQPGRAGRALKFLKKTRSPNYGWGTTQGTVLALRAAAQLGKKATPPTGSISVRVDGKVVGSADLTAPQLPSVVVPGSLRPGRHTIDVAAPGAASLDLDLRWGWRGQGQPVASEDGIEISLRAKDLKGPVAVGERVFLELTLKNTRKDSIAMPTVVLPRPPGFSLDGEQLKSLVKRHAVSKAQDQGSEAQLYLRELRPGQVVKLPITLRAETVCDVMQRPAVAYAYYDPEVRGSSAAMRLQVVERASIGYTKPRTPRHGAARHKDLHASMP